MQRINKVKCHLTTVLSFSKRSDILRRLCSSESTTTNSNDTNTSAKNLSGFAKSVQEHDELLKTQPANQTFPEMLRNSKLMDLGNPEGKIVTGKIYHVTGNDLYIDFNWKFHCVCRKPLKNAEGYVKDAIVRLKIKDLELSTRFLGSEKDLTLSEADCVLLGLVSTPFNVKAEPKVVRKQ